MTPAAPSPGAQATPPDAEAGQAGQAGEAGEAGKAQEAGEAGQAGQAADQTEQAERQRAAHSVIERMLAERQADAGGAGTLRQTTVSAWQGGNGTLAGGIAASRGASCLIRPGTGDTVLAWCPHAGGSAYVVAVLAQAADAQGADAPTVLSAEQSLALEAPSVGITAKVVHVGCEDLLTHARNAHTVEHTRTETARVRVAQIGTDIRRATTVDDEVSGTLLQRTGTWISNTVREARFKARSFLFD